LTQGLDAGAGYTDRVDFLKGVAADSVAGYLTGQHHQWNRVHVRGCDTGHRIGRARTRGYQADARLAGGARVTVRRMRRPLLVAHEDVKNVILLLQCVINM